MKARYWYLLLTMLTFAIGLGVFGRAGVSPNQYFFSSAADGFKAYFATEYYLRHHEGGAWHDAFQYPFGSHLLYMDMNPLVSGLLSKVQPWINLAPYTVGIINFLMILSLFPCAWLMFALLRRSHLPPVLALSFALIFTFLSPQLDRITAHLSLGIVCYVPLIWYLSLRLQESQATRDVIKWLGIYGIVVTLFGLMHPYYALLGVAWLLTYTLVQIWQAQPTNRLSWSRSLSQIFTAISPLVFIKGWEWVTTQGPQDFVTRPFGQLFYRAGPETLFLPMHSPFLDVWNAFIRVRHMDREGYAYVGLAGTLILLSLLYRIVEHIIRRKGIRVRRPVLPDSLRTSLWTGAFLLIPAMAYPMYFWPPMVDYLGPLAQFRSLGRLSWLFFYPFVVFSAWWLYALYRALGRYAAGTQLKRIAVALILLASFSWIINAAALLKEKRAGFLHHPRTEFTERQVDYQALLEEKGYSVDDFQAILALPPFNLGSEKFSFGTPGYRGERAAMAIALDTGLPICNSLSARSPLTVARLTLQLASHPLIDRELPSQFPTQQPLLLVSVDGPQPVGAAHLLSKATPIAQTDFLKLHMLPLSVFDQSAMLREEARNIFYDQKDSLYSQSGLYLAQPTSAVYWESFGPKEEPLGQGVWHLPSEERVTMWRGPMTGLVAGTEVEISCWVRLDQQEGYLPFCWLEQYRGEERLAIQDFHWANTHDVIGNWARVACRVPLVADGVDLDIQVRGRPLVCDQLLIRPVSTDVYQYSPEADYLLWNNYPLHAHDWGGISVP